MPRHEHVECAGVEVVAVQEVVGRGETILDGIIDHRLIRVLGEYHLVVISVVAIRVHLLQRVHKWQVVEVGRERRLLQQHHIGILLQNVASRGLTCLKFLFLVAVIRYLEVLHIESEHLEFGGILFRGVGVGKHVERCHHSHRWPRDEDSHPHDERHTPTVHNQPQHSNHHLQRKEEWECEYCHRRNTAVGRVGGARVGGINQRYRQQCRDDDCRHLYYAIQI